MKTCTAFLFLPLMTSVFAWPTSKNDSEIYLRKESALRLFLEKRVLFEVYFCGVVALGIVFVYLCFKCSARKVDEKKTNGEVG